MKRKIAILLSAMMVTSAMPFSASAAQLKSDSVQNTTFAKSGETIDPKADQYDKYETENELRGRKSVLKVNLNDDGTDKIEKGTSFNVKLTNGTFGDYQAGTDLNNTEFGYRNVNNIGYTEVESLNSLSEVYSTIANASKGNQYEPSKIEIKDNTGNEFIQALYDKIQSATSGDLPSGTNVSDLTTWLGEAYTNFMNDFEKQTENVGTPALLHIPYSITLVSPTEARITTLQDLTNEHKKIPFTTKAVDLSKLDIKLYESNGTEITAYNNETELKKLSYIEIVDKGDGITTSTTNLENPYIALPLGGVIADGNGAVKATVVADYNDKVVGGEYTITRGLESGSTSLVFDSNNVKSFEDKVEIDSLTLRENVRNTIGKDTDNNGTTDTAEITLRLSGGFKFKDSNVTVVDASGKNDLTNKVTTSWVNENNQSAIKVKITGLEDRNNPIGLDFSKIGTEIVPANDNNYGDVEITVSGDGISGQTILVAKREKLGFKLETVKDAQEIVSGRHFNIDKNTMVEDDNNTVEVKFSEAVPNTLVSSRALDFDLPEGVKIVDVEVSEAKNFSSNNGLDDSDFEIINNGRTLRLTRDSYAIQDSVKSVASFKLKFNLSVDPSFTGDIKLSVSGGGQSEGTTPDVVIAKAVAPFEIKTQTTKVDLGYQDYNTADIVITETKPGMLLANETAELKLVAPYGTSEVGFSQAKFEVTGGELNVKEKDFKISNGVVSFKVDRSSYKNPSTITIKDVKIGSTRSVPFGSYNLALSGKAVLNNYAASGDKVKYEQDVKLTEASTGTTAAATGLRLQNNTEYYEVKDYVNVITETGTFNQTVKVSVGEKTVLVGDQAYDMDVAPYIQASSNSTMVPLRFVSVALGVDSSNVANPDASNKIAWDANTKTTTIYYGAGTGQKIIQFQAGSNIMVVDGTRIPMEYGVVAEIKDGRMFVPFRALGQALGVTVSWDADTRTAIYNENNARNANTTTTASTTESTTASSSSTTESTTESTTASTDSTTETTTAANK